MNPAIVVDVGNTRIKWGRVRAERIVEHAALPPDAPDVWRQQIQIWGLSAGACWTLAGVHPARRDALARWLRDEGFNVAVLESYTQLPIAVEVEQPHKVGLDRLLNAIAANNRRPSGHGALVVDAGSAVTVDWLSPSGAFLGGAILPGLRLMARALADHTALLPLVECTEPVPPPGRNTTDAIRVGILHAVAGAIEKLCAAAAVAPQATFLTGGDGPLLAQVLRVPTQLWPEMTLEGIRLATQS